jgi:hypothetical protein
VRRVSLMLRNLLKPIQQPSDRAINVLHATILSIAPMPLAIAGALAVWWQGTLRSSYLFMYVFIYLQHSQGTYPVRALFILICNNHMMWAPFCIWEHWAQKTESFSSDPFCSS